MKKRNRVKARNVDATQFRTNTIGNSAFSPHDDVVNLQRSFRNYSTDNMRVLLGYYSSSTRNIRNREEKLDSIRNELRTRGIHRSA
jgi:hypothetical protein